MEEELWRRDQGEGIMEEESLHSYHIGMHRRHILLQRHHILLQKHRILSSTLWLKLPG